MKIGDKVRSGFDHMLIYPSMVVDSNCFSEDGSIISIDKSPSSVYPIVVELTAHAMPNAYKDSPCNNVSFNENELVLCK